MSGRAVLWDMDGTLVESEALHFAATRQVLESEGLVAPAELQFTMTGRSALANHAMLTQRVGLTLDYHTFISRQCVAFLHQVDTLKPRHGALAAFSILEARHVPQAVVSNSNRMLVDASLRVIGLQKPDRITVSRNDVRDGKPDPEPYLRAAWLLGADPAGCIVVEDSPTGACAGLAAGMTVLAWPEATTDPEDFPKGCIAVSDATMLLAALTARLTIPHDTGSSLVSR